MRMRKLIAAGTVAGLATLGIAVAVPRPASASSCGSWRWPVKTGSDKDRYKVDKTTIDTSISHLRSLPTPSSFPSYYQDHRFRGAERHTWTLKSVHLTQYKIEDDYDIHLVIKNRYGKSMIAEIPRPACVPDWSLWKSQIAAARRAFLAHDPASTDWKYVSQRITLRGLGFFDEIHDVTGQAPNGIELHPVTRVYFPSS
jgi:hypothetical protein